MSMKVLLKLLLKQKKYISVIMFVLLIHSDYYGDQLIYSDDIRFGVYDIGFFFHKSMELNYA